MDPSKKKLNSGNVKELLKYECFDVVRVGILGISTPINE